ICVSTESSGLSSTIFPSGGRFAPRHTLRMLMSSGVRKSAKVFLSDAISRGLFGRKDTDIFQSKPAGRTSRGDYNTSTEVRSFETLQIANRLERLCLGRP